MSHNSDHSKIAKQSPFSLTSLSHANEAVFYDEESASFDCWPQRQRREPREEERKNQAQRVLFEVGLVLCGALIFAVVCTLML